MCGIIGYTGKRSALPVLIQGLECLEYRGYDSAGIACIDESKGEIFIAKEKGKLEELKKHLNGSHITYSSGIGHTRWATHGVPSRDNAHPHFDCSKRIVLAHNGIIENYEELRDLLKKKGHVFKSQTDSEVAVHLIEEYNDGDLLEAFQQAIKKMHGFFAFVVMSLDQPGKIYAFKRSNPLVLGVGERENFAASDVTAIMPYTRRVIYLEDNEIAVLDNEKQHFYALTNLKAVHRPVSHVTWSVEQARKEGFPHFMLKEIHEQPKVLRGMLEKRVKKSVIWFDTLGSKADAVLRRAKKIFIVSCGTAYHAGLVGRCMIESFVRVPVEVNVSSEFRYSDPIVTKNDLVILITQSGETADTLAALREAQAKGAHTLAIVNVVGSTIAREADHVIYTHAGPEIGVASTKAYTAQLMTLALFTLYLARLRRTISTKNEKKNLQYLRAIPASINKILSDEKTIESAASELFHKKNFLYLGRGFNFPSALEGALKLKEISYAHAHGYPAGEMKHGPIALIDEEQPVICIAPQSETYEKMMSNVQEIQARKGIIVSIVTEGDKHIASFSKKVFQIPKSVEVFSPILVAIPLQLFAYKVAVKNRRDVDQPRNLAKSVTVE